MTERERERVIKIPFPGGESKKKRILLTQIFKSSRLLSLSLSLSLFVSSMWMSLAIIDTSDSQVSKIYTHMNNGKCKCVSFEKVRENSITCVEEEKEESRQMQLWSQEQKDPHH